MAQLDLVKGENAVLRRQMFDDDGITPLNITTLSLKQVQIWQNSKKLADYVFGTDPELRQGEDVYQLEVEIKKAVSDNFVAGLLKVYWITERPDAAFIVDGVQKDVKVEDALVRVLT